MTDSLNQFWTVFNTWDHLGQGVFMVIALGLGVQLVLGVLRYGVVLLRGWPTVCDCTCDEEEETT